MKMEAGICIHLSYKMDFSWLWVFVMLAAFIGPAIWYFILKLIARLLCRRLVVDMNTKRCAIHTLSFASVVLIGISLTLEACVTISQEQGNEVTVCPPLEGWKKAVFQTNNEPKIMKYAVACRAISFLVSWLMVILQMLDKRNKNLRVGLSLYLSSAATYVLLGGSCVEVYAMIECSQCLRTGIHTVLNLLSTFGSTLSTHIDLVSESDQNHENELRQKDVELRQKDVEIERQKSVAIRAKEEHDGAIDKLKQIARDTIRDLKGDLKIRDETIATLTCKKSEALQKYNDLKKESDEKIDLLNSEIAQLQKQKDEALQAPKEVPRSATAKTESFVDNKRKDDILLANISAAQAVADAVRTSLGPRGMDKMISTASSEVIITNDGATILNKMEVLQPAAKFLVELSKSQDVVAGDGTTTVVIMAGALLKACLSLLTSRIHPTKVTDALHKTSIKAVEVLTAMAVPVELSDRESLVNCASTALNSMLVSQDSTVLAPLAVDAVLSVVDPTKPDVADLRNIRIVKKLGGTVDDTETVKGLILDKKVSHVAGGPTRMENAKIAVIQFQISPPKTDIEHTIVVTDYMQMDRILKEERKYILGMIQKIQASGCNVLLIQKSILRDAVTELALHYLAKAKMLVIKDVERDEIEFITKTLNCLPVANIEHLCPEKFGYADLVEEISLGEGSKIVKMTGIKDMGRTGSVLVRGSNRLVLDEAERRLHDAMCVVRCLVNKSFLIAGGGAPEIEVSCQLGAWAKVVQGMEGYCVKSFAEALEVIPYMLAENAGLNPISIVTELRNRHGQGEVNAGINVSKGQITNMLEEKVVQPLLVTTNAITLATQCVSMILNIDDILTVP